ncbi:MAG: peptidylprolyl isomerase, partial [Bacteroidaceae bacterium]|nr:peptidylprolyl isomerase [Bacteroidaceae bacterium]
MPRRLLGVLILLLVSVAIGRAQGDAVLFSVGTDTVRLHEFEYHWSRSKEKQLDVFLQTYGHFKQKVQ